MYIIIRIILLVIFNVAMNSYAQPYNIDDFLPGNVRPSTNNIRKIKFFDKTNDLLVIHDYDKKGRLTKLTESVDPEIATKYIFTKQGNKEICKVYSTLWTQNKCYELYIIECDSSGRITLFTRISRSPEYDGDSISGNFKQLGMGLDSTNISRRETKYSGNKEISSSFSAKSNLFPEALLGKYAELKYSFRGKQVTIVDKTNEHYFNIIFNEENVPLSSDSIFYMAGKTVKRKMYTKKLYMGADVRKDFISITNYKYDKTGYVITQQDSYLSDKERRINLPLYRTQVITNESGMEIKSYTIGSNNKKVLLETKEYEYY